MAEANIDNSNVFTELDHTWKGDNEWRGNNTWINTDEESNNFINGNTLVKTVADDDNSNNAASTEWVNKFFNKKDMIMPTIDVPLLTPMWFDHIVDSPAWIKSNVVRSDNGDWYKKEDYPLIYNHLLSDYNNVDEIITETICGIVVKYKKAVDGHKIISASDNNNQSSPIDVQLFNKMGVCWFYVLSISDDDSNKQFRLPRTKFSFQGARTNASVGNFIEPGLPDLELETTYVTPGASNITINPTATTTMTVAPTASTKVSYSGGQTTVTTTENGSHRHEYSFRFTNKSGGDGVPTHGGGTVSGCKHSSDTFETSSGGTHSHSVTVNLDSSKFLSTTTIGKNATFTTTINSCTFKPTITGGSVETSFKDKSSVYRFSSTTTDNASSVQPPATEMYLYFSTGVKNFKTDDYFPSSNKTQFILFSKDETKYYEGNTATGGIKSYTASNNGWVQVTGFCKIDSSLAESGRRSLIQLTNSLNDLCDHNWTSFNGSKISAKLPVKKGQIIEIKLYGMFSSDITLTFVKCSAEDYSS